MARRFEGERSRAPLVIALLFLSAISGLVVAMLSGSGLGSGASPTWIPPVPSATPTQVVGQAAAPPPRASDATAIAATEGAESPITPEARSKLGAAALSLRTATPTGNDLALATPVTPQRKPPPQASAALTLPSGSGSEVLVAGLGSEQSAPEAPFPTPSFSPSPTPSPTPMLTATPVRAAATPTAPPSPRPTAEPLQSAPAEPVVHLSPPELAQPVDGASVSGEVIFGWLPTAPLPPGAAYEVVWWNLEQDPATAGGIAPPTVLTALQANLDVMYEAHQLTSSQAYWTVLIVRQNPYERLTQPADSPRRLVVYQPRGSGGGESSPPPLPKP